MYNDGLKKKHEAIREKRLAEIKEAIEGMRERHETINYSTLAEEIGVNRRSLYADYIRAYLKTNFKEFNPAWSEEVSEKDAIIEAASNYQKVKSQLAAEKTKSKALAAENRALKLKLSTLEEEYERLLARYQEEVGQKIIHI